MAALEISGCGSTVYLAVLIFLTNIPPRQIQLKKWFTHAYTEWIITVSSWPNIVECVGRECQKPKESAQCTPVVSTMTS